MTRRIVSSRFQSIPENGTKFVSRELDKNNKFSVEAKQLSHGTKYYYKAFLNVGGTYSVGDVRSFTTEAVEYGRFDDRGV
ncbi:MAG: hypothetical protein J6O51_09310 [Bacteroidales bacterium]|nr:hypothetical protein [Bacteroidales bacterium]